MGSALGSGQFWSWLELAVNSGDRCGGNSWCLLREVTPAIPLLPKPCCINPIVALLKGSDLHTTNTQNVSWWSSELLCVLLLHIREKFYLCLRKDFTFQAECKFTLKRGSQIDLCYYCIFNRDGNKDRVSFDYTGFIYLLHSNSI